MDRYGIYAVDATGQSRVCQIYCDYFHHPLVTVVIGLGQVQKPKGAVKLHAALDYDSVLPCYAAITDGKKHDVKVAEHTLFPLGSVPFVKIDLWQ